MGMIETGAVSRRAVLAGAAATGALAVGGAGTLAVAGATGAGAVFGGGAARIAGASRAAAGAGTGRPPTPPSSPPTPPRPSNDNPPRSPVGGAAAARSAPFGVGEPAARWEGPAPTPASATGAGAKAKTDGPSRPTEQVNAEARRAEADFKTAAAGASQPRRFNPSTRRSAALQSFFVANAGRSLLPGGETSGSVSPQLKSEET